MILRKIGQEDIQISREKLSLVLSLKWIEIIFKIYDSEKQSSFTCANSIIETLKQFVKSVQS